MIELFVTFGVRTQVNIEVVDLRAGLFHHQMRELQRGHAADRRAIFVVVLVAAAHAMHNRHRLRHGHAVAQHDLPLGGTRSVAHALEFQTGEDVFQPAIAVLRDAARIEELEAGRQDHVAHFQLDDLVFHIEADRLGGAHFFAHAAFAVLEVGAMLLVDHGIFGHGLREGAVDGLAIAQARLEDRVQHADRAFVPALAAAGAQVLVHMARPFAHAHREVAHVAGNVLDLAVGQ